jgi:hypothetical protein
MWEKVFLKKVAVLLMASMVFGGSLWAIDSQRQKEIAISDGINIGTNTTLSLSLKGADTLTDKIDAMDMKKLANALNIDFSSFIKTNDALITARDSKIIEISNFKTKNATKLANKNWAMTKHLEKLELDASKLNKNLDEMGQIYHDYSVQGMKITKNGRAWKVGTKIAGGALDVISVYVTANELLKAQKSGNDLRFKHKRDELLVTAATTIGFIATGAAGIVTIPAGIAVGIGAMLNDMTENLNEQNKEQARNKIEELDAMLSTDNVEMYMNNTLKRISQENKSYTTEAVKDKLKIAFNTEMSQMLNLVNYQLELINKRRMDLPLDGEGPLIRNEGDLAVYNWLIGQKDVLQKLQANLPFSENATEVASFREKYIDNVADKYVEYQQNFFNSDEYKDIYKKMDEVINLPKTIDDNKKVEEPIVEEPKEPTTSLEDKKLKADSLLSENKKRAQEYEVLYIQLKKDPNNKVLQQRVVDADQLLRDSTVNYIVLQNEIRQTDSKYGSSAYSRDAIRDRIDNNYSQIDSNKEKLAQLEAKEKALKSKINDVNESEESKKNKEMELASIQSQISQLGAKLKEFEKGTDEYSYVLNNWANLVRQKTSILNEIRNLTNLIENQKSEVDKLQSNSYSIMQSIVDTSDYNNDTKINLTQKAQQTTVVTPSKVSYNDWKGYMTGNVRIKGTAGELRYWGGNFDDDLNDHPGGFTLETNSKTGNVENVQINHGPSYDISYNEIQKSDYNANPKNVQIWKVDSNGNNTVVEATGSYTYTSWGIWQQDGGIYTDYNLGHGIEHNVEGHWVAGDVTVDLPKTGSATYNGTVAGSWYTAGDLGNDANRPQYGGAIKGTMAMTVDFSNAAIVAGNLNLKKADNSSFATATMNNMQMNTTNNAFHGKLIGANIMDNGQSGNVVKGRFYGPKAEEIGGNWNVNKTTGEFASGVFAGKK